MKKPSSSLLARARRYAGRTAFVIAPLAVLGAADSAWAVAGSAPPTLNPTPSVTYGPDDQFVFTHTSGTITGSALAQGTNGVTGVKLQGTPVFTDPSGQSGGSIGNVSDSLAMFSLTGAASGTLTAADGTIPVNYDFTLASTAAGSETITITGFTLTIGLTTSSGTTSGTVTRNVGAGLVSGTLSVPAMGASSGATLNGYSASLTVNFNVVNEGQNATISVAIPANSIDINGVVPEPSTWAILATGAGLVAMQVRGRRARSAPDA